MKKALLIIILFLYLLYNSCFGGVISQWKLNDNALSTTVVDAVGPHNGTFKDATGDPNTSAHNASGKINGCLDFDGTDDYVEVGDHADFTPALTQFSISAWVYIHEATSRFFVSKYDTGKREWTFGTNASDYLILTFYDESANAYISRKYESALTENQWLHVAATSDGGKLSAGINLYLDGTEVDDANDNSGSFDGVEDLTQDVYIGRMGANYYDGLIDNLVIINKELTAAEVRRLYNGGAGIESIRRSNSRARYSPGYNFQRRNRYKF